MVDQSRPSPQVLVRIRHLHILIALNSCLLTLSIHLCHRHQPTTLQSSSIPFMYPLTNDKKLVLTIDEHSHLSQVADGEGRRVCVHDVRHLVPQVLDLLPGGWAEVARRVRVRI